MCLQKGARLTIVSRLSLTAKPFFFIPTPPSSVTEVGGGREGAPPGPGGGQPRQLPPGPCPLRLLAPTGAAGRAGEQRPPPPPPAPQLPAAAPHKFGQQGPTARTAAAAGPASARSPGEGASRAAGPPRGLSPPPPPPPAPRPGRRLPHPALTFHLTFILRYNLFVLFESARG